MSTFNPALIIDLTKRDFKERFAGSLLGSVWAFLWPLSQLFIYIVIFSKIMGARLEGDSKVFSYGIYLASGLIPWTLFSTAVMRGTTAFLERRHLISKISISLPSLLVFVNLSETVTFALSMLIFGVFLIAGGYVPGQPLLLLPFVFYLQVVFALGLGLLTATLTVFIRDLKDLIGIVLQFWFWFTPIVYVEDILPDFVRDLLILNPAYIFISAYQRILVFNEAPDGVRLAVMAGVVHLLMWVAYIVFRKLEKDVRDFL